MSIVLDLSVKRTWHFFLWAHRYKERDIFLALMITWNSRCRNQILKRFHGLCLFPVKVSTLQRASLAKLGHCLFVTGIYCTIYYLTFELNRVELAVFDYVLNQTSSFWQVAKVPFHDFFRCTGLTVCVTGRIWFNSVPSTIPTACNPICTWQYSDWPSRPLIGKLQAFQCRVVLSEYLIGLKWKV